MSETTDVTVRLEAAVHDFAVAMDRLRETMVLSGPAFARLGESIRELGALVEPDPTFWNGPSPLWEGEQMIGDRGDA